MGEILNPTNLLIIGFTVVFYFVIDYLVGKLVDRHTNLTTVFLRNSIRVLVVFIGAYIFLSQYSLFDKVLTSLLTNSALVVAVLGFALQNSIKNLLAGLMLLSSETFKIGDRIRLPEKGLTGEIEELTIRHTTIKLVTNERAIIPNSIMNDAIVINNDIVEPITRYPLNIFIPLTYDISKAKKIIEEEVLGHSEVLEKENLSITLSHISDKNIEIKTLITTKDIDTSFIVLSELKEEIITKLNLDNAFK